MSIDHKWKSVTDKDGKHLHDDLRSIDVLTGIEVTHRITTVENYFCCSMAEQSNERELFAARSKIINHRNHEISNNS